MSEFPMTGDEASIVGTALDLFAEGQQDGIGEIGSTVTQAEVDDLNALARRFHDYAAERVDVDVDTSCEQWGGHDDNEARAMKVIELLAEEGITATWEYPGVVCIRADPFTYWNTGMHAWDYASVCILVRGTDSLEPDENADICVGLPADTVAVDPQLIASRWAERVDRWRRGVVGAPRYV